MEIKIFTLPFDPTIEGFPDEIVKTFCLNKKVHRVESHFFREEKRSYWTIAIHYEVVLDAKKDRNSELETEEKLLFQRLKEWRREKASTEGFPAYMIATNSQLIQMIRLKCITLESFKNIKGFGKKRIQKYGNRINELVKDFYEKNPQDPTVKEKGEQDEELREEVSF